MSHAVWTEPSSISRRSWVAETPVTAVDHQPGCGEPHGQRRARLVEDGARRHRDAPVTAGAAPTQIRCPPAVVAATAGANEAIGPAQPIEVVQALPVLVEPPTQLRVGARVVPARRRRHVVILRHLNGNPINPNTFRPSVDPPCSRTRSSARSMASRPNPFPRWLASMAMSQTHHAEICPVACGPIHK